MLSSFHRPPPTDAPARLEQTEKLRLRTAAYRARRLYPGPVGEFIQDELESWETFGYRLDRRGRIARLVEAIETAEP